MAMTIRDRRSSHASLLQIPNDEGASAHGPLSITEAPLVSDETAGQIEALDSGALDLVSKKHAPRPTAVARVEAGLDATRDEPDSSHRAREIHTCQPGLARPLVGLLHRLSVRVLRRCAERERRDEECAKCSHTLPNDLQPLEFCAIASLVFHTVHPEAADALRTPSLTSMSAPSSEVLEGRLLNGMVTP